MDSGNELPERTKERRPVDLMEIRVKAVRPGAWGWSDGKPSNWRADVLLEDDQDIWTLVREEEPRYDYVYLTPYDTLYVAQDPQSGFSSFYLQTADTAGYGGREIPITLINGATVTLKGPWSSNSAVVNRCIDEGWLPTSNPDPVTEVTFYSMGDWRNVGMAAAMSIPKLRNLVDKFLGNRWHLAKEPLGDGWTANLHAPEPSVCEGRL